IDIEHVDEAYRSEFEIGMERPLARARIGGRFEPSCRNDDIVSTILIHVADADAMPKRVVRYDVRHEAAVANLIPRERRLGIVEFRQHLAGLAVVIEIHQEGELRG